MIKVESLNMKRDSETLLELISRREKEHREVLAFLYQGGTLRIDSYLFAMDGDGHIFIEGEGYSTGDTTKHRVVVTFIDTSEFLSNWYRDYTPSEEIKDRIRIEGGYAIATAQQWQENYEKRKKYWKQKGIH